MAGLSERVIGITIISVGTGLPELFTSVVAAYKGHNDIAIANVIGSNIINTLGVIGLAALIRPLESSLHFLSTDFMWMIAATLILFPLLRFNKGYISRAKGGALLAGYVSFIVLLLINA